MKNNSPTVAGQTNSKAADTARIDAINQVFTLLKLNYHNQFHRAFSNTEELNSVKRLWLESLSSYAPETLLKATKSLIQGSEFLPTLKAMLQHCQQNDENGLPDPHAAYIEACRAPSPKSNYAWSHPAVYYAGKNCDWFFLQTNSENVAYPVFKKEYEKICQAVMQGSELAPPEQLALPENTEAPLERSKNRENMASLREKLDL